MMKTILPFLCLFTLLLLGCHSSERGNPLDPVDFVPSTHLSLSFDSKTAMASLSWDKASERGFEYYIIRRKVSPAGVETAIDTIFAVADTTSVDPGLEGNTEYAYRVVTWDTEGEEHPTDWMSGGFHMFLDEWRVGERSSFVPFVIGIDHEDCVYVGVEHPAALRIRKYDSVGNFLLSWSPCPIWYGPGVMGIACDSEGNVYVNSNVDRFVDNVMRSTASLNKFDRDGNLLWTIETDQEPKRGTFSLGVAVDSNDEILVLDTSLSPKSNIHRFDGDGEYVGSVRIRGVAPVLFLVNDLQTWDGFIGFADLDGDRIWIADLDGSESAAFPGGIGRRGIDDGQLSDPISFAVDDTGRFFVVDAWNSRVQVFTGSEYLLKWGSQGSGPGEFELVGEEEWESTGGIALDSGGNVYVVDSYNNRIQKFGP